MGDINNNERNSAVLAWISILSGIGIRSVPS